MNDKNILFLEIILRVRVRLPISIIRGLPCVLCFEVTNSVWVERKIDCYFDCNNCSFKKEQSDSLRAP